MKEQCENCHNMVVGEFTPQKQENGLLLLQKKEG